MEETFEKWWTDPANKIYTTREKAWTIWQAAWLTGYMIGYNKCQEEHAP